MVSDFLLIEVFVSSSCVFSFLPRCQKIQRVEKMSGKNQVRLGREQQRKTAKHKTEKLDVPKYVQY